MDNQIDTNRQILIAAISGLCLELGFESVEKAALGTLTELCQCFLTDVGLLGRNYCELAGRTEPLVSDVTLAFVDMGFNFAGLDDYIRQKHTVLPPIQPQSAPKQINMLSTGVRQELPSHVPPYLPDFPVPHAYIRTPTHRQPILDYESVREKAAVQKKDIEKALTKFLTKTTSVIHNLFDTDEVTVFTLIATKPAYPPYLSALLPQDQIFDQEDLEDKKETEETPKNKNRERKWEKEIKVEDGTVEDDEIKDEVEIKVEDNSKENVIDNPYLAATKYPDKQNKT